MKEVASWHAGRESSCMLMAPITLENGSKTFPTEKEHINFPMAAHTRANSYKAESKVKANS